MIDEMAELQIAYDELLMKLNVGNLSLDEGARMEAIENIVASRFGYDWMRQHLCDDQP